MDAMEVARVVIRYLQFEEQLLDFLRHVPPQGENLKAWSPTVATVIKESCGLLESLLKRISPATVRVGTERRKRKDLKIKDLAVTYAKILGLTRWKVILLFHPPEYRTPFHVWEPFLAGRPFKPPHWWTTHNHLKHDEISAMHQATADTALNALAGLLLTIAAVPQMTRGLMQADLIHWDNVRPDTVVTWALGGFPQQRPVIVKTKLFAVILGGRPLPDNIIDFRPLAHARSRLLVTYFDRS